MHSEKLWQTLPGVFNSLSGDVRAVHILPHQPQWLLFLRGEMRAQFTHCSTPGFLEPQPGIWGQGSGRFRTSWGLSLRWVLLMEQRLGYTAQPPLHKSPSFLSMRSWHFQRKTQQSLLKRLQSVNKQIAHLITLMMLSLR